MFIKSMYAKNSSEDFIYIYKFNPYYSIMNKCFIICLMDEETEVQRD